MADPLTALIHAVQVMNFLKTLIIKTLREREVAAFAARRLDACSESPSDKDEAKLTNPSERYTLHTSEKTPNFYALDKVAIGKFFFSSEQPLGKDKESFNSEKKGETVGCDLDAVEDKEVEGGMDRSDIHISPASTHNPHLFLRHRNPFLPPPFPSDVSSAPPSPAAASVNCCFPPPFPHSTSPAPAATKMTTKARPFSASELAHEAKREAATSVGRRSWAAIAANCCLLLVGAGGGALLAWWALSFHHSNQQLWMVPVGLVLLGTPIIAWLSVFVSGVGRSLELLWAEPTAPPAPDLDAER
ncbi:hypothetical protein GW17_00027838 [Ensete ventricosum]|nr:hypothetical protein GW17_00027838 [Ensete ventricosum]